jgi:REP element-mobilizing transposase RayT
MEELSQKVLILFMIIKYSCSVDHEIPQAGPLWRRGTSELRDLIREICKAMDVEILKGHVSKDHVHLFRLRAAVSVREQIVKSRQRKNLKKVVERKRLLAKAILGSSFVGSRLLCRVSSGNVTDEVLHAIHIETSICRSDPAMTTLPSVPKPTLVV